MVIALHYGEEEDECDGPSLPYAVCTACEGGGHSHDEGHIDCHDDSGDPEGFPSAPSVNVEKTDDLVRCVRRLVFGIVDCRSVLTLARGPTIP